jgi:cytoskeletal protein CcmA (bactofilin family)
MWKRKSGEYEVGGTPSEGGYEPAVIKRPSASYPALPEPPPAEVSKYAEIDAKLHERFGKTQSALGAGTVVQGKLSFSMTVRIDGKLSGEISSSRAVIVGHGGEVDAQVEVATLIVIGKVRGDVRASERVEILAGGEVHGSVTTPVLLIEEGSVLNGMCTMTGKAAAQVEPAPHRAEGAKETKEKRKDEERRAGERQGANGVL